MATNSVNAIDAILRATSPRLIVTAVTIGATGGSFLKAKNTATLSPASITLTTSITGLTAPTYQWYYASSLAPTTWTSIVGATLSSYVVTNTNYLTHKGAGTQVVYKCVATQTGWATSESSIIITYSQQSNDVPIATLSKTSLSLPTTSADVVDYATSACDIVVSIGGTNIPYGVSGANTYSVATSSTNITVGTATTTTTTVTNDTRSFGVMSAMSVGQVTATITYTVTARDADNVATVIKLVQTITKATAGTSGTEVSMSSSAVTLNADAAGVVTVFTNSGNTFTVTNGGTTYNFANTGTAAGTFKITTVASNVTPGSWTGYGTGTATLSNITAMTANTSGTLTFTILVYLTAGVATTFTKVQNFTQAKPGNGSVFAYRIITSSSLPAAPTVSTGIAGGWLDANNTPNAGSPTSDDGKWYAAPPGPMSTNMWCFQVSGSKSSTNIYSWQSPAYLSTFKVGQLSALSANIGNLVINTGGTIVGGSFSAYHWPKAGATGYVISEAGLAFGSNGSVIYAGSILTNGQQYRIAVVGTSAANFTSIGADATPAVGEVFTYTGVTGGTFTGTGALSNGYDFLVTTNLVVGKRYRITIPGTTSFTSVGAANNNINTVFKATGTTPSSGSGGYVSPVSYVTLGSSGNIDSYGFSVVDGVMTINEVNVIDTLNIKGSAVTNKISSDTGYLSGNAAATATSFTLNLPSVSTITLSSGAVRHVYVQADIAFHSNNANIASYLYSLTCTDTLAFEVPISAGGYVIPQLNKGLGIAQTGRINIGAVGYDSSTTAGAHTLSFTLSILPLDINGAAVVFNNTNANVQQQDIFIRVTQTELKR